MFIVEKNGKKRKASETVCLECGSVYKARLDYVKAGKAKFCCIECSQKHKTTAKEYKCDNYNCGKLFKRSFSKVANSKSGKMFCSRECKEYMQSLEGGMEEIQPKHYSNGLSSYRSRGKTIHGEVCNRCGYDEYKEILQVHHIDCNRENNKASNLEVLCPNCHMIEHLVKEDAKI